MKILYVEDHPHHRKIMKELLELSGYNVVLASNGAEGIEKAKEELPDVVVMDLRMPNMDGVEAIKHLKSDPAVSNIPVIAISAWTSKRAREDALRAGAVKFLAKPFDSNRLINEINTLMSSKDG
jgi:CheY-like chemotaxis protein